MKKKLSLWIVIAMIFNMFIGVWGEDVASAASATAPSPTVVPANGSTNVPVDIKLQISVPGAKIKTNGTQMYTISTSAGGVTDKKEVTVTESTYRDSIVLTPPTLLQYNTVYTVSLPEDAFTIEGSGETTAAYSWSFTTAKSSTTALSASFSPGNGSTNVSINTKPTITFNRNIRLNPGVANGGITLKKSSNNAIVPITVSASSNLVTIYPTSSTLEAGTSYYIEIAGNGIYDAQNTLIYYAGISGSNRWSFQTAAPDKTAPVLQSATMYSNTAIRLLYNEPLLSTSNLPTSYFTVTVNGETRRISYVTVSGDAVYVNLETGVAVGQDVKISYTGSTSGIRDVAGNAAAAFTGKVVTNGIDSVMPKPKDGYATSNTVTLYFSDSLKSPSSYAYQQFTVTANGSSRGISSLSHSGSTITLYLSSLISNGDVVKVSYTPGSYPLQDYRGFDIAGFTDYFVRNTYDSVAPVFQGVEGSGNKVILTYNEALRTSPTPLKSQFSILVNNAPVYVTGVEIVSNQVILTLASSFTKDQNVTLSYVSGTGGIADLNGNLAGYINLQPVTYSTVVEGVRSATVTGDTLTITFNSTLKSASYVPVNQFYVNVDNVNRGVQSATISGNTVILKLSSAVTAGQVVTLSYLTGAAPLYDNLGNMIKSFNNLSVQNLMGGQSTTPNGVQPDYLTVMSNAQFGVSGYLLNVNTAQATDSRSRLGAGTKKYTIDNTKLQTAFRYLVDSNASVRKVVFEVPSTEKAAEVVVPLSALMDVYSRGKTASFMVKYNHVMYELPVEKIPFTEISRLLNVSALNSAYLTIQLETVTKAQLPGTNYSNGVTTTPMTDPVQIYVSAFNGVNSQNAVEVSHNGQLYFRATNTSPNGQFLLMKYDVNTQTVSFVPSKTTTSGSAIIFNGKINGNAVVGPAVGYSYFSDTTKHWARADINELASRLIVTAASGSKFEPEKKITRAEFAVYIAKGLGLTGDESYARRFPDVSSGTTAAYIGAAAKAGIINGNTDGTFKPNSNITREQMALMMVRAMEYAGYNTSMNGASAATLTKFKDAAKIQSKDTVAKAVKEGIIQGITTNTFQPQGNATRAQAAVMLKRVLDKLNYI
ncbi:SwmB domain-containing protein [Paenibacillus barengoltzii]|uniref:Cyanobacterial long protein n=1 Tax=Paenibacillus barengoltzii G22 TaxID=1235795 RepID=R9L5Q7_9BACL|nr:SwmB domain-containing protein [Paenibacillus barengoltzii]EOS54129.1 cyanobacterial long protein [Paenibacillus barengoltzii G22]